nr:hypothetical protein [uncultured Niameybacter sp.]
MKKQLIHREKWSGGVIHITNNTISCILAKLHIGGKGINVSTIIILLLIGMSI